METEYELNPWRGHWSIEWNGNVSGLSVSVMKSAYPSNYLLLMPKNKTSFTFTEQQKKKEEQREKERKTDGVKWPTQEANGNTRGNEEVDEGRQEAVSHRWRRSAYVTCLVFLCPALNLCAKSLSRQLLNSQNVLFLLRVFLVSVLCRFLRQLSARLLHRLVPDKLCELAPLSEQTRTHFDHFSSCNFV